MKTLSVEPFAHQHGYTGYVARVDGALVGWYPSETEARGALRAHEEALPEGWTRLVQVLALVAILPPIVPTSIDEIILDNARRYVRENWPAELAEAWTRMGEKICECGNPMEPCPKGPGADEPGYVGFYPCRCWVCLSNRTGHLALPDKDEP